ncbi:uncharacterized protein [Diadema antillarum]|uniref:uncharacterized protein n=1 Tax=Diadema antillarum TaxID=105358 RepID=UPI003A8BE4C3
MKLGENYPPEGHFSMMCSNPEQANQYRILSFGGARRNDESTWEQTGSAITEFFIIADDEDVSISSSTVCKTKVINLGTRFMIWGGLDLCEYRCRDDLLILEELPRQRRGASIPHFQVTYVETLSSKTPSRKGYDLPHQTGSVPSGRTGHTLTKIPGTNRAILFGGLSMQSDGEFGPRWRKACKDGRFYFLDTDTFEWTHVKVPLLQPKAYHSANILVNDHDYTLAIVGGVVFNGRVASHRVAINEVIILTMDKELKEVTLDPKTPNLPIVFISSHATTLHRDNIIVSGGIQTYSDEVKMDEAPSPSPIVYSINITDKEFHAFPKTSKASQLYATFGHTLHNLTNDNSLLVLGGTSKQISLLTDRDFEPEPCEYEPCTIASSSEKDNPVWVQCDSAKCKKWYHTFCAKVVHVPSGNYYCKNCK